uniref:LanC-like protein 2 n=2 Tax=Timema TaxID=61471 RepID=A0A7R8VK80_TIMDO|nr:unnamed protein product [Timema douglasi]
MKCPLNVAFLRIRRAIERESLPTDDPIRRHPSLLGESIAVKSPSFLALFLPKVEFNLWGTSAPQAQPAIHHKFLEKIQEAAHNLLAKLEASIPDGDFRDVSIYTGSSGIALLYTLIGIRQKNSKYLNTISHLEDARNDFEEKYIKLEDDDIVEASKKRLREDDSLNPRNKYVCLYNEIIDVMSSFGSLFYLGSFRGELVYRLSDFSDKTVTEIMKFLEETDLAEEAVVSLVPEVSNLKSDLPDEILYGRAGYLYNLLYLNKHIGPDTVSPDHIKQVVAALLQSGQQLARREKRSVPLMYMWHGKYYIGGAHGISGILYMLLLVTSAILQSGCNLAHQEKIKVPLMYRWYGEYYVGAAHGISGILYTLLLAKKYLSRTELDTLLRPTIDYLQGIRYPSKNFPSSLNSDSDRLVHWCHGAPGAVYLFTEAYKVFGDDQYMQTALDCGEVVWKRGLLAKGYSICHGVSGNAYTFLHLYQVTGDLKHLHRACQFADWCFTYGKHQTQIPDRPLSLFEGIAGVIYFLFDIQEPNKAQFPGYSL